jgi:hypothetical protein
MRTSDLDARAMTCAVEGWGGGAGRVGGVGIAAASVAGLLAGECDDEPPHPASASAEVTAIVTPAPAAKRRRDD